MFNITSSWTNVIPTEQFHGGVTSSVVRNTLRFPKKEPSLKYLFHWCCYVSHNPASIISRLFVKVFPTLVYSPFSLLCLWWCCYAKHNLILNKCNSNIEVLPLQWFTTHWGFRRKFSNLNTQFHKNDVVMSTVRPNILNVTNSVNSSVVLNTLTFQKK